MNKNLFLIGFLMSLLFGCAPKEKRADELVDKDSVAYINEGYYTLENPLAQIVPAIAIKVKNGMTLVYGLLSYNCDNKTFAIYGIASEIWTDQNVTEAHGPAYTATNQQCELSTKIEPVSFNSIKLILTINGIPQSPYILTSANRDYFVENLKKAISPVQTFSGSELDCQDSLNLSCKNLQWK